ncbi:MAG: tripartite tricarboxylate transporter TctB family protein [Hyphomicrobiales bacterium]|nr:tripartite tricarboxylate transporter TctB family protein [Hyphomicrobiales bacterium]
MRLAELVMAVVMGIFSLYLMWKSAELEIGWIPEEGPGGGAWPFWLAFIMLLCCLWLILQWVRGKSPLSQSTEVYMDRQTLIDVSLVAGSLTITVALFHVIGVYGALPLFLIFYIRFLGNHTWTLTAATAVIAPVAAFFFFEIALKIILPKGYTEPAFYPLYRIFL